MDTLLAVVTLVLLVTVAGGMVRVVRGPSRTDRMLAAALCGTSGCAILLVLAEAADVRHARDVALAFLLVASLPIVAMTRKER